jgi:hypothetical protein
LAPGILPGNANTGKVFQQPATIAEKLTSVPSSLSASPRLDSRPRCKEVVDTAAKPSDN